MSSSFRSLGAGGGLFGTALGHQKFGLERLFDIEKFRPHLFKELTNLCLILSDSRVFDALADLLQTHRAKIVTARLQGMRVELDVWKRI